MTCECELATEEAPLVPPPSAADPSTIIGGAAKTKIVLAILPSFSEQQRRAEDEELRRWPTSAEVVEELRAMGGIAGPMVVTGLLLYARAMISMLFLGRLGKLELAGGSLAIGFANITGYSVLAGLAMGMEPICGQACGARKFHLMGVTLQRTFLVLMAACLPIAALWLNMRRILLWCGQDAAVTAAASTYILWTLPDLIAQSVLNPLRIYLRSQRMVAPLAAAAAAALLLVHVPLSWLLVAALQLGVAGVAVAAAATDFALAGLLLGYLAVTGRYKRSWSGWSRDCLRDWRPLLNLALPSCASVCLEWWWYEIMVIASGLLPDSHAALASMGILIQTTALVYILPSSLALAVSTRVGNELGAGRPHRARFASIVALLTAALVGGGAAAFAAALRHRWAALFTTDPSIRSLTAVALPILGLCELGNCPQTAGCGVLRGCARPATGVNINLSSFYVVGMPVAVVLGFFIKVGFPGLWLGLLAAQATCAVLMLLVLCRTDWRLQAERSRLLMTGDGGGSGGMSSGGGGEGPEVDERQDDPSAGILVRAVEEDNRGFRKEVAMSTKVLDHAFRVVDRDEEESLISVEVVPRDKFSNNSSSSSSSDDQPSS